jgi:hypothetical protein
MILSTTIANSILFINYFELLNIFYLLVEIDSEIPALKCEFLPESTSDEILFISISPFSGLYKVVSYMGKFEIKLL